ncbi:hypothetical protein [Bradyrhizobium sp. USDA 3315]
MADRAKLPPVEEADPYSKGAAGVTCAKSNECRWLMDRLEDDEVREVLKSGTMLTPSASGRLERSPHEMAW